MTTVELRSRPAVLVAIVGCATAGLAVGWSFTTTYQAQDEAPREELKPSTVAHAELPCDRIRSELEGIRRDQERGDRGIHFQHIARNLHAGVGESGWPQDAPSSTMPFVFEETVLDLGQQLDVTIDDVDCEKYPCFAVLADTTSESSFNKMREELDGQCGASLQHYGAVRFNDAGQASYAVACVPLGESEEIDELKDGLRERAFERLGESIVGKGP